jgi:hypothetical protein
MALTPEERKRRLEARKETLDAFVESAIDRALEAEDEMERIAEEDAADPIKRVVRKLLG